MGEINNPNEIEPSGNSGMTMDDAMRALDELQKLQGQGLDGSTFSPNFRTIDLTNSGTAKAEHGSAQHGATTKPVKVEPEKAPDLKLDTISDPKITIPLIKLLKEGKIEEFNKARPLGRLDFSGQNFSGLSLKGADLRYIDFTRAQLNTCDLTEARCQYTLFNRAELNQVTLDGTKFFKAQFNGCEMTGVKSAVKAEFQQAKFESCQLPNGNFSGSYFNEAQLISSNFANCTFKAAQMLSAVLICTGLNEASFLRANLHKATFMQVNGTDVDFRGANLTRARAIAPYFASSNKESTKNHPHKTTFEGAWVKDFVHQGTIPTEMLTSAFMSYPPEDAVDLFDYAPDPDNGNELVEGIPGSNRLALEQAMGKLDELIGQESAKKFVADLTVVLKNSVFRKAKHGLKAFETDLNVAIVGPPGTGKSTFAEILIGIYYGLGLLRDPEPIQVNKSGFVAGYLGQTTAKVEELFEKANQGRGVVAEEIYTLNAGEDSYSADAISVIADQTSRNAGKHALFLIGYKKEMLDFLEANSGLARRFEVLELSQQTSGELIDIAKSMLKKFDLAGYDQEFLAFTSVFLEASRILKGERYFGNAGDVRTIVRKVGALLSGRLDRQGLKDDKVAQQKPLPIDLPFQDRKLLGIDSSAFPDLNKFTWVTKDGKTLKVNELPLDGEFPEISQESIELLRTMVEKNRANTFWSTFEDKEI